MASPPLDPDQATRLRILQDAHTVKRAKIQAAADELRTIKLVAQHLASEMNTRLAQLDARVLVLSRTVANLLGELDHDHTTRVTRLLHALPSVEDVDPLASTQQVEPERPDPRIRTPPPTAGP
jgi:hypothetical protein